MRILFLIFAFLTADAFAATYRPDLRAQDGTAGWDGLGCVKLVAAIRLVNQYSVRYTATTDRPANIHFNGSDTPTCQNVTTCSFTWSFSKMQAGENQLRADAKIGDSCSAGFIGFLDLTVTP